MVVRKNTMPVLGRILKPTGAINSTDDIFDEQVIWKNNWQMYGSRKPSSEPYRVTHHWSVSTEDGSIQTNNALKEDHSEYVETLSIRNKYEETRVREEMMKEIGAIDLTLKQTEEEKSRKTNLYNKIIQNGESNFKPTCEEMNLVRRLISIMDKGLFKDTVVGMFDIDLSQVYFKDDHTIQN